MWGKDNIDGRIMWPMLTWSTANQQWSRRLPTVQLQGTQVSWPKRACQSGTWLKRVEHLRHSTMTSSLVLDSIAGLIWYCLYPVPWYRSVLVQSSCICNQLKYLKMCLHKIVESVPEFGHRRFAPFFQPCVSGSATTSSGEVITHQRVSECTRQPIRPRTVVFSRPPARHMKTLPIECEIFWRSYSG